MHTEKHVKSTKEIMTEAVFMLYRLVIIGTLVTIFVSGINPAKVCGLIGSAMSLFTCAVSYSALTSDSIRALNLGWVNESSFVILFISSIVACLGLIGTAVSGCMSLGSLKLRRLGNAIAMIGVGISALGMAGIFVAYKMFAATKWPQKVLPDFPLGFLIFAGLLILIFALSIILLKLQPKPGKDDVYELKQKYKLFLLLLPFLALAFLFAYLPLWGWRYAFYDYNAGDALTSKNFVGFKWFTMLFQNRATRADIIRVLKNTLAMSGLGLGFSWVAMVFAIFLCEIKNVRVRRFIQTFTTIPNFISWVLVYSIACVIFSSDGLISNLLVAHGGSSINFLMSSKHIWLKMFLWGQWKGIGWNAIIYIAGIAGIDQQLYEAATVDGAGRFQKMWNVTVPGLIPTFMVLFIMSVAFILSNGLEQYFCFQNANNTQSIEVLDLYVYTLGIGDNKIPLSTVIGMCKSLISVALLFGANKVSKLLRGENII